MFANDRTSVSPGEPATWVVALDVTAKVALFLIVLRVALDPAWGNLEGKAPGTRAVTYPMLALLVPAWFFLRRTPARFPWEADLLLTLPAFSDVLGNRLDLYDRLVWFDDVMHFMNTGLLSAAVVLLSGAAVAPLQRRLELAVAAGMTLSLAWEGWEYFAFVTRSAEMGTAYADTVGDLTLGWAGAVVAALLVGLRNRDDPASGGRVRWTSALAPGPGGDSGRTDQGPSVTSRTVPGDLRTFDLCSGSPGE